MRKKHLLLLSLIVLSLSACNKDKDTPETTTVAVIQPTESETASDELNDPVGSMTIPEEQRAYDLSDLIEENGVGAFESYSSSTTQDNEQVETTNGTAEISESNSSENTGETEGATSETVSAETNSQDIIEQVEALQETEIVTMDEELFNAMQDKYVQEAMEALKRQGDE